MTISLRGSARWAVATVAAGAMVTTVAVVSSTAASTPASAPAQAAATTSIPVPDNDPFYAPPAGLALKRDGTVLRSRKLPADALAVPAPAQVWQLLYKSRDNAGRPTAVAGTLLVPTARWTGSRARPLLSYQVPEDGLSTTCAPSYVLRAGSVVAPPTVHQAGFDRGQVAAAVKRGWTVMVPDYEGPKSEFFGAASTAAGVLDGIRAARSFGPAQISRKAPIGLWGYSGGGFATAVSAQKQSTYAPELPITAVAAGGVPADLNAALGNISGKFFSGWIPFGLAALRNSYPELRVDRYLNGSARAYSHKYAKVCAGDAVSAGPYNTKLEGFEAWPGSLTSGRFHRFSHKVSPVGIGGTPHAPMYMYHGTADELLPIAAARQLYGQYRAHGANVVMVEHAGQTHGGDQEFGAAGAVAFLTKKFAQQL